MNKFLHRDYLNFYFTTTYCVERFGFIKGKNTTDAMVDFVTEVITALDK